MPSMHCHAEEPGARLAAPCCCDAAPRTPAVAEGQKAPYLPERPLIAALPAEAPKVYEWLRPTGASHEDPGSIDRSPPLASPLPLRI